MSESLDARANALLARMTLDEKLAQVGCVWSTQLVEGDGFSATRARERYSGWERAPGSEILAGKRSLAELGDDALARDLDPKPRSGGQERLENLVNRLTS